jgi:hypothetical protein
MLIFQKLVHISQWETQGEKLQTTPCVLTIKMDLEIIIGVINNWEWDKGTH